MMGGAKAVLVMHSDGDQIVSYVTSGPRSAALLQNGGLVTCRDFPHGLPTTEAATINADILSFLRG
jgi:non-heme chloroperoxidase